MKQVLAQLKEKAIYLAIFLLLVLVIFSAAFAIVNQFVMKETTEVRKDAEFGINKTKELLTSLHHTDMGVRGFALGKKDGLLFPFEKAKENFPRDVEQVRTLMKKQNYPTENYEKYVELMNQYIKFSDQLVEMVRVDS